jgi:hypothetical protein
MAQPTTYRKDLLPETFVGHALAVERELADLFATLEKSFDDLGESDLTRLCGELAALHIRQLDQLLGTASGAELPEPESMPLRERAGIALPVPTAAYCLCVTRSRHLLAFALGIEDGARRFYQGVANDIDDDTLMAHALTFAVSGNDRVQRISLAIEKTQANDVDWESLLADGGGPGLALGAERRLRRGNAAMRRALDF